MSSEDTLIGSDFELQIGDGNSPEVFTRACSISDVQNISEVKPLIDVTAYCDEARTFRGGLKEGQEVTIVANLIEGAADIASLFDAWDADENINVRFAKKVASPDVYFQFGGPLVSWNMTPPVGDKATLSFTLKISGGVIREGF